MPTPLVSVLIPCFNAARFIGETLQSVLAQTWSRIEIIVVDDGSTDASREVVASYLSGNVRLLQQDHGGAAAARNRAYREAQGDFIQFLDADDLLAPDKLALQMNRLRAQPDCVASAEWSRFCNHRDDAVFERETVWRDMTPVDWLVASRAEGLGMLFPALWLIPRPLAEAAGPWNEALSLADDGEYFTRIVLAARHVLFCPGARCYYRSGIAGSLSGSRSVRAWQSGFRVVELCEQHVRAREDSERVRRGFALSWQHMAHACYPYDRVMAERALARAATLHGIKIAPGGGATFRLASRYLGWRLARRLQVASGRP